MNVNWKNKVWKYATAVVVGLIILNPELVELALFIDVIGLEVFLMLLEIQVAAILGVLFNTRIKSILAYIKRILSKQVQGISWKDILENPKCLLLVVPDETALMHTLVFSAILAVVLNAL
jgi:hypothetical protein